MSNQYPGGFLTKSPTAPTSSAAPGIWTLDQAMQNKQAGNWPTPIVIGQVAYTTPGTYTWVAPAGVTSVSTVVVGANDGFRGSALAYKNNIAVTPGSSYTVFVSNVSSNRSYFINTTTVSAGNQNARTGDGGGDGGNPGGAGGYSGNGGGGTLNGAGLAGSGGGGGGGGDYYDYCSLRYHGGGGGVGLLGQGSNGSGGSGAGAAGGGGSGGANGTSSSQYSPGNGGNYGGGAGFSSYGGVDYYGTPGGSALRIIWPGTTRQFPSTNTGDM